MPENAEYVYVVKTDSPSQGKGVIVQLDIEQALDDVRVYVTRGIPVRIERVDRAAPIDGSGAPQ